MTLVVQTTTHITETQIVGAVRSHHLNLALILEFTRGDEDAVSAVQAQIRALAARDSAAARRIAHLADLLASTARDGADEGERPWQTDGTLAWRGESGTGLDPRRAERARLQGAARGALGPLSPSRP